MMLWVIGSVCAALFVALCIAFCIVFLREMRTEDAEPPTTFVCGACGSAGWGAAWSDADYPNICPNCTGAT